MEWSIEDCFSCGSCPSTLDEHRRTQTGEKLYDCDICHSSHIRKFELVLHVRCTHEPTFRSALFPKYFQRRELMGNHKRIHIDFRPDECEYCGNVLSYFLGIISKNQLLGEHEHFFGVHSNLF